MARVLVVDDEARVRRLVALVVGQAGHEVSEAASGGQAARLIEDQGGYDLLILDLNMGLVSGWLLLEELHRRDLRGDMRVVVLSGRAGEEELLRGRRLGVDEYCTKPFDPYVLLTAVENVLTRSPEELERHRRRLLQTTELPTLLINQSPAPEGPPPGAAPDGR